MTIQTTAGMDGTAIAKAAMDAINHADATDGGYTATVAGAKLTLTHSSKTDTLTVGITNDRQTKAEVPPNTNRISVEADAGDTNATENALDSIVLIDAAIKQVNVQRSELGAVSNRLNHTVNNLTNISSNLSAAKGGIEDADFALETTNLAKNQILQQASTAMLAQANASKQNVLSLLQG